MYRQKFKALEARVKAQEEENRELREKIEKLVSQNTSKYEGINNKLSDFAQKAIETAKGPLTTEQLLDILMKDVYGKRKIKALNPIRQYSNDIDGVRKQLSKILENLQVHVGYRKKQKELDDKLTKILKKLDKTIKEEKEREVKSGTRLTMQTTLDQYFPGHKVSYKVTHEVNYSSDQNSSKDKVLEESDASKEGMPVKEEEKYNRKRKNRTEDESSSSQEDGIRSRSSKRLKTNASKNSAKSSDSTEFMSVDESDELMSVEEGNQSSTQPMSISEGSASQSDAMSVDDSTESTKEVKTIKNQTIKSPKQHLSRFRDDTLNYNGKEATVPERDFNLRGKPR